MMRRLVVSIVLLVVSGGAVLAQAGRPAGRPAAAPARGMVSRPAAPALPSLEGLWKGDLEVPGGQLSLGFSLVALTNGSYFAALDVPMQKLNRVPVDVQQVPGSDSVRLLVPTIRARLLARLSANGDELRGTWAQNGKRSPVVLRHDALPSLSGPATRMAPPYQEEEIVFTNFQAKLKLGATFTAPTGPGPYPAVVLLSDLGDQNRDGQAANNPSDFRLLGAMADYLTRHGFAVLRLDDRGVGKSEGRNGNTTPVQRAGDAQAALNYLRTRSDVDLLHLGLIGHGEGASIALLVAAQPLPPAFVVGLGAYGLTGYDTLLQQLEASLQARKMPPAQQEAMLKRQGALFDLIRYSTNLPQTQTIVANMLRQGDATMTPEAAQQVTASLLTPWNRAFLTFNPLESLPAVQCPVLLITGQLDEQAPPAQHLAELERELKSNGNHRVTAVRPAGVNHLLQPPQIQWTMLDGEMKPVLSPAVAELLQQWLTMQVIGKKEK